MVLKYENFLYICTMERKIITYGGYFESFMSELDDKTQTKIQYGLMLLKTQDRMSTKFVKHIIDGLFELRTEFNSNIYRVFFVFDGDNIVVLFNGFQKKTKKTPQREIEKALKIKAEYYADKRSSN
jgi:phage-related protein